VGIVRVSVNDAVGIGGIGGRDESEADKECEENASHPGGL
jgi:hypothetical protein